MEIVYSPQAVEDLKYWKKAGDNAVQKRISLLLPEQLIKHFIQPVFLIKWLGRICLLIVTQFIA